MSVLGQGFQDNLLTEKTDFSIYDVGTTVYQYEKKWIELSLILYMKNNPHWATDLNIRAKAIKVLDKNIENICVID